MSACESRMSPSRGGSYLASSVLPVIFPSSWSTALSDTRPPTPTLKTFPDTLGASHPSKFACTALSTYVKSRVCSPCPKTSGCASSQNALQYLASTPEYGELGSCLGPKMLQ